MRGSASRQVVETAADGAEVIAVLVVVLFFPAGSDARISRPSEM